MKKLRTLVVFLLLSLGSFAQARVTPFEIHYRDDLTKWEFISIEDAEMPYLYFYTDDQANFRNKITKIKITNGWDDFFKITSVGEVIRDGSAVKWKAVDKLGKNCTIELVARESTAPKFKYTQLYIRYANVEYVYSFVIE